MIDKRGYATKLDYQETRERLEEYVKERGCVPRERAIRDVIQRKHTKAYYMNTCQLGQIIKYSRARGVLTSFVHKGQYFITTVDKMNEFTRGNWKEVNEKAREPKKENFLTEIIKKGRNRLKQEEIDTLQQQRINEEFGELEEQPIKEVSTYKYDRVPRDEKTGQYKKKENKKNE